MISPADFKNPARKSGYDGVKVNIDHRPGRTNPSPYQAVVYGGKRDSAGTLWSGPPRATAYDAALDRAEFLNANGLTPRLRRQYPKPTVDMGNPRARRPRTPSIEIVRNEYTGPTDLYDVLVFDGVTGDVLRRKVGVTARGEKRYADICTTFGFSIKPVRPAVTYKTKALALAAETALVAEVAGDPNWRRVGKEAFAPAHPMTTEVRA